MITVLEVGPERQVTCWKCKSKLGYSYTDMQRGMSADISGSRETYKYISCPICTTRVEVK